MAARVSRRIVSREALVGGYPEITLFISDLYSTLLRISNCGLESLILGFPQQESGPEKRICAVASVACFVGLNFAVRIKERWN